jgi:hypothetical protein
MSSNFAREVRKPLAHEHLPWAREAAEARCEIQRPPAVAPRHGHRLAGVEADAYPQGKWIFGSHLLDEPLLKRNGRANRGPRGAEDDERLIAAEFDETAVKAFDHALDDLGERSSETSRRFVAVLLRVPGISPNVSDQERPDLGFLRAGGRVVDIQAAEPERFRCGHDILGHSVLEGQPRRRVVRAEKAPSVLDPGSGASRSRIGPAASETRR